MPRHATQDLMISLSDFSKGTLAGISERGVSRPNWLAGSDNVYGLPYRALKIRPGSRNISEASLSTPPHSLMSFYGPSNKLFVATEDRIYEVQPLAYVLQTIPGGTLQLDDQPLLNCNVDGLLIVVQYNATTLPITYDGTSWKELKLPPPTTPVTFGIAGTGGDMDDGFHRYRVRWRYDKGSSKSGPFFGGGSLAPNKNVPITGGLNPTTPRDDYVGWTLERAKVNGTDDGPWWFVADGNTDTYLDEKSDAQLGYIADEGLHEEPVHFDGVTQFAQRLWGWAGSSLYCSQAIGDLEATGVANFDPDLLFQIAKDDGDRIQACIPVLDELLILKARSVHVISGVDPESFVLRSVVYADPERGSEAGCCGPRAVCSIGGKAYFWGEFGGIFSYSKGNVSPEAWIEMGRYIQEANPAVITKVQLVNHQGNFMLAWYPKLTALFTDQQIVLDARLKQWWHWIGWPAADVIELKSGLFNNATMIYADPVNRSFFPEIPPGSDITEVYLIIAGMLIPWSGTIPSGTTIPAGAAEGDTSIILSQPATETLFNVTLLINGVLVENCNTVAGSNVVTTTGFRVIAAFDAFGDNADVTGFSRKPVDYTLELPWVDMGMPDEFKDLERISMSAIGASGPTASIYTDPAGGDAVVNLVHSGGGSDWAADAPASFPNDLVWDVGDWASDSPTTASSGVPLGTVGRRHKVTLSGSAVGEYQVIGVDLVSTLLPDKEY